jgi:methyl-accepting chemotaxis protein
MKSIRFKLVVLTLVLIIVPTIISSIANIYYMNREYMKELEVNNKTLANGLADQVSAFIDKGYSLTEQIMLDSDVLTFDQDKQKEALMNVIEKHPYFDLIYIQDENGIQTARTKGELGDRSNRWWFIKAKDEGKNFVSKSYYSLTGNVPVTTVAMPMYNKDDKFIGVMASDIKLDKLQEIIEKSSKGSKYSFLIDGEGVVIAHPDRIQVSELYNYDTMKKTVLKKDASGNIVTDAEGNQVTEELDIKVPDTLNKIIQNALNGENGFAAYKNNEGVEVVSAYNTIKLPGDSDFWAVITVENKSDAMEFIRNTEKTNFIICIFVLFIAGIIVSFSTNSITIPIKKSSVYLKKISSGDFTGDVEPKMLARKDEIGIIAHGIQEMKDSLRNLAITITEEAVGIEQEVEIVMSNMYLLNDNFNSVSATSEELSASMEETAAAAEQIANTSQEIEKAVQNIAARSQEGALSAKEISIRAEETKQTVHDSQKKAMEVLEATKEQLEKSIEESKVVDQINVLSEAIMQITSQTNLLALNASIEAARAGEAGRGFTVVADEIRKLAEKSKQAVTEIQEVTNKVTSSVENLTINSNHLLSFVSNEVGRDYNSMLEVAEKYSEDAIFVEGLVTEFSAISEELFASVENILVSIEEVATAASESADGTADIAERVSEVNLKSNEVTEQVEITKSRAETLRSHVSKFQV